MQQQARSRSIPRACVVMSLELLLLVHSVAHGAIIARALGVGMETSPCCEDVEPIGVVELGTASSQPSSCCESCLPLSVYHEPAWLGLRVTMLSFELRNSEDMRLNGEMVECCVDDGMGSWWGSFHSGVKSLMSCNRRNLRSAATSNILTHIEGNNSGTEHYSDHRPFRVLVAFPRTSRSAFTASNTPFSSVNLSLRPRYLGNMTSVSVKLREGALLVSCQEKF
jgi:hypothetical protein